MLNLAVWTFWAFLGYFNIALDGFYISCSYLLIIFLQDSEERRWSSVQFEKTQDPRAGFGRPQRRPRIRGDLQALLRRPGQEPLGRNRSRVVKEHRRPQGLCRRAWGTGQPGSSMIIDYNLGFLAITNHFINPFLNRDTLFSVTNFSAHFQMTRVRVFLGRLTDSKSAGFLGL